jgi:hypothetical protein
LQLADSIRYSFKVLFKTHLTKFTNTKEIHKLKSIFMLFIGTNLFTGVKSNFVGSKDNKRLDKGRKREIKMMNKGFIWLDS